MTAASRATAKPKPDPTRAIAFQGAPGAYGDLACREAYPEMESLPCPSFEDAFAAVRESRAALGMIAVSIDNVGGTETIRLVCFPNEHGIAVGLGEERDRAQ